MSLTLLPRHLETQENGEVVLVRFVGSKIHLDTRNTDIVQEKLVHFVDELGQRKFVLDFGHVESVSGRTLGVLVQLHTKIQAVGGLLILCNMNPLVYQIFEIAKLHQVLDIRPDEMKRVIDGPQGER